MAQIPAIPVSPAAGRAAVVAAKELFVDEGVTATDVVTGIATANSAQTDATQALSDASSAQTTANATAAKKPAATVSSVAAAIAAVDAGVVEVGSFVRRTGYFGGSYLGGDLGAVLSDGNRPAEKLGFITHCAGDKYIEWMFEDGTLMRFDEVVETPTDITADANSFTVTGPQNPISTITVNGQVLDFTTGSVSGAEGSTGLNITLAGFNSQAEAFGGNLSLSTEKTVKVSLPNKPWVTIPGNDASIDVNGTEVDTTVFGYDYNSNLSGIIEHTFNSNALFRKSAGYVGRIRTIGMGITFTDEPSVLNDGWYEIADRIKSIFDHESAITVLDNGVPVPSDEILELDYLHGRVKLKPSYVVTSPITFSGEYLPTATLGCFNSFDLAQSSDTTPTSCFDTVRANGGYQSYKASQRTVGIDVEGFYQTSSSFTDTLQNRDKILIEIDVEGDGETVSRGYYSLMSDSLTGGVGGDESESLSFSLYVIEGVRPFSWRFGSNSNCPQGLRYIINAWENKQELSLQYFPQGESGKSYFGNYLITDCSISSSIDGIPEASVSGQGTGVFSLLSVGYNIPEILSDNGEVLVDEAGNFIVVGG